MTRYLARRVVGMIPTLLVLLFMVVVMVRLVPGSIVDIILEETASGAEGEAARAALEERLGLDRPLPVSYVNYVTGVLRGDLGQSLWDQSPVTEQVLRRLPPTLSIAAVAIVMAIVLSVPIGVLSAVRRDTWLDYLLRSVAIAGISVPSFVIGTAFVIFPALWFGLSLVQFRYVSFVEDPVANLKIIIPPAAVLAIGLTASVARLMRTMMLEVLTQDYMRTARAKGLTGSTVIMRHGLKNAMIPVITLLGLQFAFLIGGSVITESIFAIPGLGRLLIDALRQRDYPIIQGVVLTIGVMVMLTNLLIDMSYAYLDPRVRFA
ncbi:MAG: ABC transporter permease subunit [Dehalococcoidia bacterium]|nr:ABC transporter permease subunit [Dehalococcoidia bacterium]